MKACVSEWRFLLNGPPWGASFNQTGLRPGFFIPSSCCDLSDNPSPHSVGVNLTLCDAHITCVQAKQIQTAGDRT